MTPETVGKLIDAGWDVRVQAGAGNGAGHEDTAYQAQGAEISPDRASTLNGADVAVVVSPEDGDVDLLAPGSALVGMLDPVRRGDLLARLAAAGVEAFAVERLPRITRAQSMDVLSSQALVAGYRAVLVAAERLPRFLPMSMTAAGTIPPAKVLILGAGVAGLQAIATARRLGAVVSAYDVRKAAAEEVGSLGATFIDLGMDALEGTGGYAREMDEEYQAELMRRLGEHIRQADIVITTAAVPGRPAPRLVTAEMLVGARSGAVVFDLAAETGGNVEGSVPGEEVRVGDAIVIGARNVTSPMADHASALYARNLAALLLLMTRERQFTPDFSDEVVDGTCVVHEGEVRV